MKENIIEVKSFLFAKKIVTAYLSLKEAKHFELARQLMRSCTSIGANVAEGIHAQSANDFIHKLSISQKETGETMFWIKLLRETHILDEELCEELVADCKEIQKILTAILKTSKNRQSSAH